MEQGTDMLQTGLSMTRPNHAQLPLMLRYVTLGPNERNTKYIEIVVISNLNTKGGRCVRKQSVPLTSEQVNVNLFITQRKSITE